MVVANIPSDRSWRMTITSLKRRNRFVAILVALAIVGIGGSVRAVWVIGAFSVSRQNTGGISCVSMADVNSTLCTLSSATFRQTDGATEGASCIVGQGASTWTLVARLDETADADV